MPSSPASNTGTEASQPQQAENSEQSAELQQRYDQLEDRYKRALADLDNYRKRSARETQQRIAESREAVVADWLEAVDSVERALQMEPENPLFDGLRAVLEQMEAILDRYGVTRVGAPGEPFDPERHEAIGVVNTDELPDRSVATVARSGYAMDDRLLRPAQVIVAQREQRET